MNSQIDPDNFSLQYASVDAAVEACLSFDHPVLASVDLKDAYKAVGIAPCDWHLMGLKWSLDGEAPLYFFSKVLSFGLRSAPALFDIFASVLELFMSELGVSGKIIRYVDDFLLVTASFQDSADQLASMIGTSRAAGFTIQESKVIHPCRSLEFLGIVIDLDRAELRISDERMGEILDILGQWKGAKVISKRRILKIVGKLAFAARVVRTGRAFLGRLIGLAKSAKALNHRVRLSGAARRDLQWWINCLASHNGTSILKIDWSIGSITHVFTDASDRGYGAVCGPEWIAMAYVGGAAFPSQFSINWRELHAAVKALASWAPSLAGTKVMFHIDNSTTCFVLNKYYSPIPELMELIRCWCLLIEQYSITVAVVYIPTDDNVWADALSRGDIDRFLGSYQGGGPLRRVWPASILYFDSSV